MKQILIIGGGMTFDKYNDYLLYLKNRKPKLEDKKRRRGEYLSKALKGKANVKNIEMPSRRNAQYIEREIIFSNFLEIVDHNNTILIGSSLGGIFLVKYLSENFLQDIYGIHLVAAAISKDLPQETITNGFYAGVNEAGKLKRYGSKLHFHFSVDDDVVPISEMDRFKAIVPDASYHTYDNKNGHFVVQEFPEILEILAF